MSDTRQNHSGDEQHLRATIAQGGLRRSSKCNPRIHKRTPNEIWIAICNKITLPRDLLHLILTCKHMYSLAWESLHRTIFLTSSAVGRTQEMLAALPQDRSTRGIVKGMVIGRLDDRIARQSTSDYPVVESAIKDAYSTSITSLVFVAATIPSTFYEVLNNLPNLQRLHFYSAFIESDDSTGWLEDAEQKKLPVLPQLKELRLWRNEWYHVPSTQVHSPDSGYVRTLVELLHRSRHIHILHIDWNTVVSVKVRQFFRHYPMSLRHLFLRTPPVEIQKEVSGTSLSPLPQFLGCFPRLEELTVIGNVHNPRDRNPFWVWDGAIPPIRAYTGPVELVEAFVDMPSLERATFTFMQNPGPENTVRPPTVALLTDMFSRMSSTRLQELHLYMDSWHKELMYSAVHCFPQLKVLRIAYASGHVDEDHMAPFAPEHLGRLPYLETFHLFYLALPSNARLLPARNGHQPRNLDVQEHTHRRFHAYLHATLSCSSPIQSPIRWSMSDEETNEVLVAWNRYAPAQLKEVRFTATSMWRRTRRREGNEWKVYEEALANDDVPMINDDLEVWKEFESLRCL